MRTALTSAGATFRPNGLSREGRRARPAPAGWSRSVGAHVGAAQATLQDDGPAVGGLTRILLSSPTKIAIIFLLIRVIRGRRL